MWEMRELFSHSLTLTHTLTHAAAVTRRRAWSWSRSTRPLPASPRTARGQGKSTSRPLLTSTVSTAAAPSTVSSRDTPPPLSMLSLTPTPQQPKLSTFFFFFFLSLSLLFRLSLSCLIFRTCRWNSSTLHHGYGLCKVEFNILRPTYCLVKAFSLPLKWMDIDLRQVSVDAIHPLLNDVAESLNKNSFLPPDFDGKTKMKTWYRYALCFIWWC